MRSYFIISICLSVLCYSLNYGQVSIGTSIINPSAIFELSTTDQGILLPRLSSTQRNAILNPSRGLLIYNTTLNLLEVNFGLPSSPIWSSINTEATSTSNLTQLCKV